MADPTLTISTENVCSIIVKAREFDVQVVVTDPDSGSNPADDRMTPVLEADSDDATLQELRAFINALGEEEQPTASMSPTKMMDSSTSFRGIPGNAEIMASTPAAMDTATVSV